MTGEEPNRDNLFAAAARARNSSPPTSPRHQQVAVAVAASARNLAVLAMRGETNLADPAELRAELRADAGAPLRDLGIDPAALVAAPK